MKRKLLLSSFLPALIVSGAVAAQSAEYNGRFVHPSGAALATDRIIVKWRATSSIASANQAPGTAQLNALPALAGMHVESAAQIAPRLQLLRLSQPLAAADFQQMLQ
ncbi:MAG TPA: hypothetical protein VH542_00535, partial [Steroidobacteraceae bacterium]